MWPFKKKIKEIPGAKFKLDDFVYFRHRDELMFGYVYSVKQKEDKSIVYDINVCGQCPYILYDIKEDIMFIKE